MARSKKKLSKIIRISILGFEYVAINIEGLIIKICYSFVVYRHMWLNLPTDDSHFLLFFGHVFPWIVHYLEVRLQ
jgi:hypothetical protein